MILLKIFFLYCYLFYYFYLNIFGYLIKYEFLFFEIRLKNNLKKNFLLLSDWYAEELSENFRFIWYGFDIEGSLSNENDIFLFYDNNI